MKQLILTNNDCYKAGRKIVPKGLMIHSTGANNPDLKRYVGPNDGQLGHNPNGNHWNRPGLQKCAHAFIGKLQNGQVATYQTLPWNHRGWHCAGKGNDLYISLEICEDGLNDRVYFNDIYNLTVGFAAYLSRLFKWNPLDKKVLLDHSEGYKMGLASNHADVGHWFPRFSKSMNTLRADVKRQLGGDNMPSAWAKEVWKWAKDQGYVDGTNPKDPVTREQLAAILERVHAKIGVK